MYTALIEIDRIVNIGFVSVVVMRTQTVQFVVSLNFRGGLL